jgi:phosphoheptose isomerase
MESFVSRYHDEVYSALRSVPAASIQAAVEALLAAHNQQRNVIVFCPPDAGESVERFARELSQCVSGGLFGFRIVRIGAGAAQYTSWQSEWTLEDAYLEHLHGLVQPGDVAIAFSHGRHDVALARALTASRHSGATTIAICGSEGLDLGQSADIRLQVNHAGAGQLEAVQAVLSGLLCAALRHAATAAAR